MQNLELKIFTWKKFKRKIELLCTRDLFDQNFAAACRQQFVEKLQLCLFVLTH